MGTEIIRSPSELYNNLQQDEQIIKSLTIGFWLNAERPVHVTTITQIAGSATDTSELQYEWIDAADAWARIGEAIGASNTLLHLCLQENNVVLSGAADDEDNADVDDVISAASIQSLGALYEGLIHNQSLETLQVFFSPRDDIPVFDLVHFMTNNQQLKKLTLRSPSQPLLADQGRLMASALISSTSLKELDVSYCPFDDNDSYQQILASCSSIEKLCISCTHIDICHAVAEMLSDPTINLRQLSTNAIVSGGLPIISASLRNNKRLKQLNVSRVRREDLNSFDRVFCDTSSLDGITSSNHTLEELVPSYMFPRCVQESLELNKDEDKESVVRQKIAKFYFVGEFDVSPFVSMSVTLLPNVMSMIGCDSPETQKLVQCSAILRMLKMIPDMSTRGGRHGSRTCDA